MVRLSKKGHVQITQAMDINSELDFPGLHSLNQNVDVSALKEPNV